MNIDKYFIQETLSESENSIVFLSKELEKESLYVLKCTTNKLQGKEKEDSLRNELEITKILHQFDCEIIKNNNQLVLVRPYFEGITLKEWENVGSKTLKDKLLVCMKISEKINILHSKKLIHKDLSPKNIKVDPKEITVSLIDFDLSARLDLKSFFILNTQILEGTLPYISPEQTGRMNRGVDYRTDLYSFGVIMFELFSGELPFSELNPLEIIHGHLSKKPVHLKSLNPDIPEVINTIVQKLLSKNAEDRYQSATSLYLDLEKCYKTLDSPTLLSNLKIEKNDPPLYFQIPEKLYGRKDELKRLLECFDTTSKGKKLLVTVSGYSGVGKSKLVNSIHVPITLKNGIFISGKFELIQRNTPYLGWLQALQQFAQNILTQDRQSIENWKHNILEKMGESAGVISSLIPEMELIIGKQTLMSNLSASEDSNRFNYALRQFLKVISKSENPLVIFLDDVQWADQASLNLLKVILTEPGLGNLLIITAYRDNEVGMSHPLIQTLEETETEWLKVNETDDSIAYSSDNHLIEKIYLQELALSDIMELVKDTFKSTTKNNIEFAKILLKKTNGNAYFIHKIIESLHEEGLIKMGITDNGLEWDFNFDGINNLEISDNVINLLNKQIEKLPEANIELLKNASCLGYQFDLGTLAGLVGMPIKQLEKALFPALDMTYLLPIDATYKYIESYESPILAKYQFKFSHDRIAQAFYLSIPEENKQQIHAQAFKMLFPIIQKHLTFEERVFDLAGHMKGAGNLINNPELYRSVYLLAGKKAKSSSAYTLAYDYFNLVLKENSQDWWQTNYQEQFEFFIDIIQCSYQVGLYKITEELTDILLKNAKSNSDYAKGIEVLLDAYFVQQRFVDCVNVGIKTLKKIGFKLPKNASKFNMILEFILTNFKTRNFNPDLLLDLPNLNNEEVLNAVRIMMLMSPSAFFSNTNLYIVIQLKITALTIKHGISSYTCQPLSNFGFLQCAITGNYEKGIAYANNVSKLLERKELSQFKTRTKFSIYFFVEHLKTDVYTTLHYLKESFKEGIENGDSDFTPFIGNEYVQNAMLVGEDLNDISIELRKQIQYNIQVKNLTSKTFTDIYFQYLSCLQGDAPVLFELNGKHFNKHKELETLISLNNGGALQNMHWYQCCLYVFFDKPDLALQEFEKSFKYKDIVLGVPLGYYLPFMESVCLFLSFLANNTNASKKSIGKIKANIKTITKLAKQCPTDYAPKQLFLNAILNAMTSNNNKTISLFESAIDSIDIQKNRFDKALTLLVYARYFRYLNLTELEKIKLLSAANIFSDMGANAVSDFLRKDLSSQIKTDKLVHISNSITNEGVDMYSVVKGSQVISSEFELNSLIKQLLPVMIENAGAEKGILLLNVSDQLVVKGMADSKGNVKYLEHGNIEDFDISASIVNFVINSETPTILDHAHLSGRFINDSHIVKNKVRSLLCMRINHKNMLVGILYLENNLISGAFTQSRIEVLRILATQAAISIENANNFKYINNLNTAYERFVPKTFLNLLNKDSIINIELGNQVSKDMTVMFADIRNFTGISEKLNSAEVFDMLNEVWGLINLIIDRRQGIVDKYIGDSIMVLFPSNAVYALKAATEIQTMLNSFNEIRKNNNQYLIHMGIGINKGSLILGTVGSDFRLNTTVIGDTVNIASRLETLSKNLGAKILITNSGLENNVFDLSVFNFRSLGKIPLKGKEENISVFEEYSAHSPKLKKSIKENQDLFNTIVKNIDENNHKDAQYLLAQYCNLVPDDEVSNNLEKLIIR